MIKLTISTVSILLFLNLSFGTEHGYSVGGDRYAWLIWLFQANGKLSIWRGHDMISPVLKMYSIMCDKF